VVDGNYSKARIGGLFLGLISIAFFIWLIVLTVKDAGAKAPQDFEWNKIAVTCSDDGDNKIDTQSKASLEECENWAKTDKKAQFIFYSDENTTAPADCTKYMKCAENETRIANNPGLTYELDKSGNWKKSKISDMTCGNDTYSFQVMSMVDTLEKCQIEASKSDHGKFIFFSDTSLLKDSSIPGCYFYDKCDPTNVHESESSGETCRRKIKN